MTERNTYGIDPEKLVFLENTLKEIGGDSAKKVLIALDGLFENLEASALIAKQSAGGPLELTPVVIENTEIVAERILDVRGYIKTRLGDY